MNVHVWTAFARFLSDHGYSTTMWASGYTPDDCNGVCHDLTEWGQVTLGIVGEFVMLWSWQDGVRFRGDSELAYMLGNAAYLLPNPFIEGNAEGFLVALGKIVEGRQEDLYRAGVSSRILYNAV